MRTPWVNRSFFPGFTTIKFLYHWRVESGTSSGKCSGSARSAPACLICLRPDRGGAGLGAEALGGRSAAICRAAEGPSESLGHPQLRSVPASYCQGSSGGGGASSPASGLLGLVCEGISHHLISGYASGVP